MKRAVIGMLAHVDAGKTTLGEAMLYLSGQIRSMGRVDHGDTHPDTDAIERERGITIFSKQAHLTWGGAELCLLDTPGHVDFSAEMERTLQVLDAAVLVISGTDGVQAHTQTLWRLLRRYSVPVFIFVTKMDLTHRTRAELLDELRRELSDKCVDFTDGPDPEELALLSEELMERCLEGHAPTDGEMTETVRSRGVFPCFFGSGLRLDGVEGFMNALCRLVPEHAAGGAMGAKVYKIMRDAQGARLSCVRLTGGVLRVRDTVRYTSPSGEELEEKISGIRFYSGAKFEAAEECPAGSVCAIAGLSASFPGQGIGAEPDSPPPLLEPVMTYRLRLPSGCDPMAVLPRLRQLGEEDPALRIQWVERLHEIHIQLMGQVQIDVLKSVIASRFGIDAEIDDGAIMYRETILDAVEGVGHFEPLRHYAEVHLLLEPLEPGSGIELASDCPEETLDRNWQRLILTHLAERQHLGVLTGSPITDMRITLKSGRAHVKHTEGGDFRQATYRAVRQGLMKAKSRLLEPFYDFTLTVPPEQLGRAINDLRAMGGEFSSETRGNVSILTGCAPVSEMNGYARTVASYTRGTGRLLCSAGGYRPCHNERQVVEAAAYDPERDTENTPDSVFCAHGAGTTVKWDRVEEYMHLPSCIKAEKPLENPLRRYSIDERELEAIMQREFGPARRPQYYVRQREQEHRAAPEQEKKRGYLIVDGYNVIFAWDELRELAQSGLDLARRRLTDILVSCRGFTQNETVLVFDAYRVPGGAGAKEDVGGVHVVFTKQGETADAYIERLTHDIGRNFAVRVVTSDSLIQLSALRAGVLRVSAREFREETDWVLSQIDEVLKRSNLGAHKTRDAVRRTDDGK